MRPQYTTRRKPDTARQVEARSRARTLGVRIQVVEPGTAYTTRSQSQDDTIYHLMHTRQGWTCTCPGYEFTGCCKHLGALERRSEREGWNAAFVIAKRPEGTRPAAQPAPQPQPAAELGAWLGGGAQEWLKRAAS